MDQVTRKTDLGKESKETIIHKIRVESDLIKL
jgi:hypothetical protein